MIELSKCPNCASEDKVTIAGKDFCMRCGTPATEQPAAPVAPPVAEQPASIQSTAPIDQATASVAKFNDIPAATANIPAVAQQPVAPAQEPTISTLAAVQGPAGYATPSSDTIPAQPALQPAVEMPAQQAPVINPAPMPATDPAVVAAQPLPQPMPQLMPMQPTDTINPPVALANQPITMPMPALEPTQVAVPNLEPAPAPINNPDLAASQPQPQMATQPTGPVMVPTPDPMQIATETPLTQTDITAPKPAGEQSAPPQIHTHQVIMSLDKNDSGVFSDEQLDELGKNMSDQTEPINTTPDHPKTLATDMPQSNPATFHTDIRPPAKGAQSTQSAQSAVSKVAENDIKVPGKDSKTKKVLKPAGIALSIVTLFLVGAYIWQLNYPTLAFKIASAKAGMSATMPGYIPGGYKLAGEIQTNPGSVSYSLVNGGQSKKISITQTKTDWDSQALAESYVAPKAENYLALQAQGLTIYMLGDSQATWVNKGTWYKIESPDQSLSQDQAIKIATSL